MNKNQQKVRFLILKSNVRKISQSILLFCIVCIYYIWFVYSYSNWKLEVCIFWVVSCWSAGRPIIYRPAGQSTELGWRAGRARLLMLRCRTPLHFSPESIRLQQGRAFVTPSLSPCPGRTTHVWRRWQCSKLRVQEKVHNNTTIRHFPLLGERAFTLKNLLKDTIADMSGQKQDLIISRSKPTLGARTPHIHPVRDCKSFVSSEVLHPNLWPLCPPVISICQDNAHLHNIYNQIVINCLVQDPL